MAGSRKCGRSSAKAVRCIACHLTLGLSILTGTFAAPLKLCRPLADSERGKIGPSLRDRLTLFYAKWDPPMLGRIDKVVEDYENDENALNEILRGKYGESVAYCGGSPHYREVSAPSGIGDCVTPGFLGSALCRDVAIARFFREVNSPADRTLPQARGLGSAHSVPQDAASSVNFILGGAIQSPVACRLSPRALPATPGTAEGRRDSGGAVPVFNSDGSVNLSNCGALQVTDSVDIHGSTVVIECGPRNQARIDLCGRPAKALSGSCPARPRNITSK